MYLDETGFAKPRDVVAELLKRWNPDLKCETVPLDAALGRVAAKDLFSQHTFPVCRAAACDGIAVKSLDFEHGLPDTTNWVKGQNYGLADTGDDFDDAFDTVIPIENLIFDADGAFTFNPETGVTPAQRVIGQGSSLQTGEQLVSRGQKLTPMLLWMLAAGGHTAVEVYKKPLVVYVPTGSELIEVGKTPLRGQNIQSAGIMFKTQLALWGAEMWQYPIVKDDPVMLAEALTKALQEADIVLFSGGSCKGSEDFTARIMAERADFFQHGVQAAPGRPAGMGLIGNTPVISLPGPPVGAFTILEWCVRHLAYAALGTQAPPPVQISGKLLGPVKRPPFPYQFTLRINIKLTEGGYTIYPLLSTRTAESSALCNGLLVVPPEVESYAVGDTVTANLLYDL